MRTRNFATVVYPESSPNFFAIISDSKIPVVVSPLHENDLNPTGEKKKSHYHVLILFDSVKTPEQAREFISIFSGVGCEPIKSLRSYARYLCHLDNPEKAQYNISDVRSFFGADYFSLIESVSDKYIVIKEIIFFIKQHDIKYFSDLLEYSMENEPVWFRHLCSDCAYIVKEYIKSLCYKG